MDDHDLWMAFFSDPDGHTLALMQETAEVRDLPGGMVLGSPRQG